MIPYRAPKTGDSLNFLVLFGGFMLLYLVSWPVEYSFGYWVFGDRGNFLNLPYLLDRGFRIGVDTYYLYGLLPVLVQDLLFAVFGRGAWPIIGCQVVYLALMAGAYTIVVRNTSNPRLWTIGAFCLAPIIIWVNQNFQYLFVHVSMMYALALILERRYSLALAVSAIGCWSVPSLPLVLSGSLLIVVIVHWWLRDNRSLGGLLRLVAPGAFVYLSLGLVLVAYFGSASVLATALPLQGASFYKAADYGVFTSLGIFLYPGKTGGRPDWSPLRYYLFDHATWWVFSTFVLTCLGGHAIRRIIVARHIEPKSAFVALCAVLHIVSVLVAYGIPTQHVFYDFLLVAGMFIGLSAMIAGRFRKVLIATFFTLGILSHVNQASTTLWLWRATTPTPESRNFYAFPSVVKDWTGVVELSKAKKLFLLTYATGVHHYYPTVDTPDSWIINWGQLLPPDKERLMAKLNSAEIVVEDLTRITTIFERDEDIERALASLCLVSKGKHFIIWSRTPPDPATGECKFYYRELPADIRMRGENAL